MNSLNVKIARLEDGSVDVSGTIKAMMDSLSPIVAREAHERPLIGRMVEEVWESTDKPRLTIDTIAHYALNKLEMDPSDIKSVQKKVDSYMRNKPEKFLIKRGIGGGVFMLSRLPKEERDRLVATRSSRAPSAKSIAA